MMCRTGLRLASMLAALGSVVGLNTSHRARHEMSRSESPTAPRFPSLVVNYVKPRRPMKKRDKKRRALRASCGSGLARRVGRRAAGYFVRGGGL